MRLYNFSSEKEINVYARSQQNIVDLIEYYHAQAKTHGILHSPRVGTWVKRVPKLEEITCLEHGTLHILDGTMGCGGSKDSQFVEALPVTPDFTVYVSIEAIFPYFLSFQQKLRQAAPELRRKNLYKIQRDNSLTFIPDDVMQGIICYDVHLLMARAKKINTRTIKRPQA